MRLLIDQLERYGVLTRSELTPGRRQLVARGGLKSALRLGVQRGEIVLLPDEGFVARARPVRR